MKLKRFLSGIAVCMATSLLWISCKKNDISLNDPLPTDITRTISGVVEDDPVLLAKVPMIISSDFLVQQENLLAAQLKVNPIKGPRGGKGGGQADTQAPSVTILSPASGSSVPEGTVVNINISASDNIGISSVSFSVDGTLQSSVAGNTAYFIWNTAGVASGSHTIVVTAKDAAGNAGTASAVVAVNTTVIITPPPPTSGFQITMPPVTSQGSEGSCVAFAVGYNLRSVEQYNKTNATGYSYSSNIFSPEFLFNGTKTDATTCSGSTLIGTLDYLKATGVCTWQSMPYSSSNGCSIIPTASQYTEAANFKISSYSMLYTSDMSTVKALLNAKHPLVITFEVDSYFYNAGPGFIWKSYSPTLYGRHAGVICGYDDAKHAYKFVNSWGTGWGDGGYTWIDYDFLPTVSSLAVTITP